MAILDKLRTSWINKYRSFICPICGEACELKTTASYKEYTCPSCGYVEKWNTDGTYSVNTGD